MCFDPLTYLHTLFFLFQLLRQLALALRYLQAEAAGVSDHPTFNAVACLFRHLHFVDFD